MLERCSLTGQRGSERNNTNVPISKMRRPRLSQISCPGCAFSPTWQADTNFVFFQIVFTRPTDTSVGWYADQVPRTCSCLLPDTCWSQLASKDSGAVTADTWIRNVANTLKANMCWLVGRVAWEWKWGRWWVRLSYKDTRRAFKMGTTFRRHIWRILNKKQNNSCWFWMTLAW